MGWADRYFTVYAASLPFSTGAVIFHFRQEISDLIKKVFSRIYTPLPFIVLALIMVNWYTGYQLKKLAGYFFYTNLILCSLMVCILFDRKSLGIISRKFDKWIGDFSYPIYLIHYQIGILVILLFAQFGVIFKRHDIVFFLVSILPIMAASWLLMISVEKPIDAIRSKIKQNSNKHIKS